MQKTTSNPNQDAQDWEVNQAFEANAGEWTMNPAYQSQSVDSPVRSFQSSKDDPYIHARDARERLNSSKKGGLFRSNSDKFKAVDKDLGTIVSLLVTGFTGDTTQDLKSQNKLQLAYVSLIEDCRTYNTHVSLFTGESSRRKARTEHGRNRQGIVDEIEKMATNDLAALMPYFDKMPGLPPEERAKTVQDALRIARTTNLKLKGNWNDQRHFGGAISDLIEVNAGDLEGTQMSGIFKKTEYYETNDFKSPQQKALEVLAKVSERFPISKEHYDLVVETINKANQPGTISNCIGTLSAHKDYMANQSYHEFVDQYQQACRGLDTMADYMQFMIHIDPNESRVNLANRNIASARLANVLGVGHLVAQAERATLEDASGNTIEGFMMEKAKGTSARSAAYNIMSEDYGAQMQQNGTVNARPALENKMTGNFQKSLADLQVLDNLFGQIDRHTENYFAQQNENGELTGVTAIDNDMGFGLDWIGGIDGASTTENQFLKYAADRAGNLTIPHMSEDLANNILKLTKTQIEYIMADVLEPSAIEGLWGRIAHMQNAIRNEKQKDPHSKRFVKDGEWGKDTLEDFKQHHDNYISTFLEPQSDLITAKDMYNKDAVTEACRKAWHRALQDGKMDTLEQTCDFILETVFPGVAHYLIQSGQVAQWFTPGKGVDFKHFEPYIFVGKNMTLDALPRNLARMYPHLFPGLI